MLEIDSTFHPFTFCFAGLKDSEKGILVKQIIDELSDLNIGYIINDVEEETTISRGGNFLQEKGFLDSDLVIVEESLYSNLPKIIIIDDDQKIFQEIKDGTILNPIAFVGDKMALDQYQCFNQPCFEHSEVKELAHFIRKKMAEKVSLTPVYGLVLTGGESSRMKRDKGEIKYYGISQVEHMYNLLKTYCSEVYVSCRKEQGTLEHLKNLPQIHDRFLESGSMGGILSAMFAHRNASWIVFACDLPMVDSDVIKQLLDNRSHYQFATTFYNSDESRLESLASIYEPKSFSRLLYYLGEGKTCPKHFLQNSEIKKINFKKGDRIDKCLMDSNTPDDYEEVKIEIREIVRKQGR